MGGRGFVASQELAADIELALSTWQPFLAIGKARIAHYLSRIRDVDERHAERGEVHDEQIWTFLASLGYAIAGSTGVELFTERMLGKPMPAVSSPRIWLEVLPMSPRFGEGPTNVDIALGTVEWRPGTTGGVQLTNVSDSWVCLIESKWYSDIDTKVSGHPERNQLARVAENAACFQRPGRPVDQAAVTLLTPARFRDFPNTSRFYRFKFHAYGSDPEELFRDWQDMDGLLKPRSRPDWIYPDDIRRRARDLSWTWPTFEELLSDENLPDSSLKESLVAFEQTWNGTRREV